MGCLGWILFSVSVCLLGAVNVLQCLLGVLLLPVADYFAMLIMLLVLATCLLVLVSVCQC